MPENEYPIAVVPVNDKENLAAFISTPAGAWKHRHYATHEEIAIAAYYMWEADGSPLFDASITEANWIDAQSELDGNHRHKWRK
jgi:hypothetical protein